MKSLSVLVVEDDFLTGILLGETLEAMGYDVCAIEANEPDAVNSAARHRPDLMIVDVRLGDGNGVSAVEEIIRGGPVAHVFVSGDVSRIQTFKPNAVVIQKPYRESDLVGAIQLAFERSAAWSAARPAE